MALEWIYSNWSIDFVKYQSAAVAATVDAVGFEPRRSLFVSYHTAVASASTLVEVACLNHSLSLIDS